MSYHRVTSFFRKAPTRRLISKLTSEAKQGHELRFSAAGWFSGGSLKQFLQYHQSLPSRTFSKSNGNPYHNVRGFRSGRKGNLSGTPVKGSTGPKSKPKGEFLLTSLEDAGARMGDRSGLLLKPIVFTAGVAGASLVGCTIWQYEVYRKARGSSPSTWREANTAVLTNISGTDILPPGGGIFWTICGINTLVYLAWRVPALSATMVTYFTATPVSRAVCVPMLLSTFSHYSLMHLAANMFVLHSFMPSTVQLLGKEQFVGFYLTAGVVSSLGSHIYKVIIGSNVPSLGASGAIMGILGFICTRMPESQLGIIFLPGVTFTADTALKCILTVDTVGLLAGWRFMDHAAHLSGCLFGVGFSYIEKGLEPLRNTIMQKWHDVRG